MEHKKTINWNDMSDLGLVYKINKDILHPLGLALTRDSFGGSNEILVNGEPYEFTSNVVERNEKKLEHLDNNIYNILNPLAPKIKVKFKFDFKYRVTHETHINIDLRNIIMDKGFSIWDEAGSTSESSGIIFDEMYPFLIYSSNDEEFVMSNSDKGVELSLSEFKKQLHLIKKV